MLLGVPCVDGEAGVTHLSETVPIPFVANCCEARANCFEPTRGQLRVTAPRVSSSRIQSSMHFQQPPSHALCYNIQLGAFMKFMRRMLAIDACFLPGDLVS